MYVVYIGKHKYSDAMRAADVWTLASMLARSQPVYAEPTADR